MGTNFYDREALKLGARPPAKWRRRWRLACFACLCLAGVFEAASLLLRAVAPDAVQARWFLMLDGLLALGTLSSLVIAGMSGIGWVTSRRSDPTVEIPDSSLEESQVDDRWPGIAELGVARERAVT